MKIVSTKSWTNIGRFLEFLLVAVLLFGLPIPVESGSLKAGKGKGRTKQSGSARYIFYTHPKRKELLHNPNGAQIVKSTHFDYEFLLGHKIVFICIAKGLPRPRVTWYKNGAEAFVHPFMQISEWLIGDNEIKSKLEIDPARETDSGKYECQADNKYAIDSRSLQADFNTVRT